MLVEIQKAIKLQDGEELMEFVDKIIEAVAQSGAKAQKSLGVRGIFDGSVIVRDFESKKFFQMACGRDKATGAVKLGEMQEVRQAFLPVAPADQVSKAEGQVEDVPVETDEIEVQQKRDNLWKDLL